MLSRQGHFLKGLTICALNPQRVPSGNTLTLVNRRFNSNKAGVSEFGKTHVARGIGRLSDALIDHGNGSYITLKDERGRYLDFTSGIGVTGLGHCHPKVSQAAANQCLSLVHGQVGIAFHKPYLDLIERLLPIMPHPSLNTFFLWNSGSEAIEAAIKVARTKTQRQNIITMQGGFHGRTFGAMGLTRSKTTYSVGAHPLMPGVFVTPFPFWHHFGAQPSTPTEELVNLSLYQLELLLLQQTSPSDTAAILIEPVLGEGGYVPAPPAFLRGLREIADKHGLLLIFDEVQSGFGRTGKYFAHEWTHEDGGYVRPDIMVVAKGLANGFPLSGIVSRKEIMDAQTPGTMGGTYAGNAVSCAAAAAVADVMKEENILDNVNARSKELFVALQALRSDPVVHPFILDIRGRGLMVGVEFAAPPGLMSRDPFANPKAPKNLASRIAARCQENGLFMLTTSVYQVLRFIPPLNIKKEELAEGIKIFSAAVREVILEG
ncbi:acetylornithine aminotransferase [Cantharellus anzutake]|uniref:acetylornithine aminotransferase n=1 Tax=Cantharellus anzutake TaxID=1750568 RepID=UPI001905E80E|nr:acetylornithine aminotransferase [Cantharellus anzutake]KAF8326675.1 acetylornithine aminotransferase [Cantharellus anzutake]